MKKHISLLLVLATVLSCFILTVSAEETVVSDEGRLPFEDVKDSHWFAPYIEFCYANGIINGMNEYTVAPSGTLTRAQFVTMLANLEGADTSAYSVTVFNDVKSNHWYYGAIAWAYNEGIVNGMNEYTFAPNATLTRAQLSSVMYSYMKSRYEVEVKDDVLDKFSDKPIPKYWYYEPIKYVVSAGLISGMANGTLSATGTVTRAQAAVIFDCFVKDYFHGACEHEFSETDCATPATCAKCGMINGLPNGHTLTAYDCATGGKCTVCEADVEPSKLLHDFASATCTKPITCTRCHVTRGEAKGHSFAAATCTAPKTCTVCKATEGTAKGHNFKAATCTEPKVCAVCNVKEGFALGHTTSNGVCERCKKEFFPSAYDKAIYYIKRNGTYDAATKAYTVRTLNDYGGTILSYYEEEKMFAINNIYLYDEGYIDVTQIQLKRGYTVYDYYYMQGDDTDYIFAGFGMLDATTFSKTTKESFSSYEGNYQSYFTDNLNEALQEMLGDASSLLTQYCNVSLKDFGFKVF